MGNNRAEEKARSALWRVLAGLQSCKGSSEEASKKITVRRKEARHPDSRTSTPRGQGSVQVCLRMRKPGAWDETGVQGPTMLCSCVRSLA